MKKKCDQQKTFATLFSGGELFGVGAAAAGWTHLWGIEKNPRIAKTANLNGFNVLTADVEGVDFESLQRPRHLHASPPCISYSKANREMEELDHDVRFARTIIKALETLKPHSFSLENVVGYRRGEAFKLIVDYIEKAGYFCDVQNINARDYGIPQGRLRLWLRASKSLLRVLPSGFKPKGWKDAIEDLIPGLQESHLAAWQVERIRGKADFLFGPGRWTQPLEKEAPSPSITANSNQSAYKIWLVAGTNANARNLNFMRNEERESFTITANDSGTRIVFPETGRVFKLSTKCLGRFQTVPDWYQRLTIRICGNGVPCDLATVIMNTF